MTVLLLCSKCIKEHTKTKPFCWTKISPSHTHRISSRVILFTLKILWQKIVSGKMGNFLMETIPPSTNANPFSFFFIMDTSTEWEVPSYQNGTF